MASADILRAAHSPLPWLARRSEVSGRISDVCANSGHQDRILLNGFALSLGVPGDEACANTEFVFRACNAHYQMLEAIKATRALISEAAASGFDWKSGDWPIRLFENQAKLTAAIAAAEAEAGR